MKEPNQPESEKMNDGSSRALIHAPNEALRSLRNYTSARVALGRSGSSIVTADILDFQLAHAQARDAVKAEFDVEHFAQRIRREIPALEEFSIPVLTLNSAAPDRENYIRRPDLGRVLAEESADFLKPAPCDVALHHCRRSFGGRTRAQRDSIAECDLPYAFSIRMDLRPSMRGEERQSSDRRSDWFVAGSFICPSC